MLLDKFDVVPHSDSMTTTMELDPENSSTPITSITRAISNQHYSTILKVTMDVTKQNVTI